MNNSVKSIIDEYTKGLQSDITDDLKKIRVELLEMEKEYIDTLDVVKEMNKEYENSDSLINEVIKEYGRNLVKLTIGGKSMQTYLENLLKYKDSLFYKIIRSDLKYSKVPRTEFNFERTDEFNDLIITYLRTGLILTTCYSNLDKKVIREEMEYYGLWDALHQIRSSNINIVHYVSTPLHDICKKVDLVALSDKEKSKNNGIALNSPAEVTFTLEYPEIITSITISGCKMNTSSFAVTNGMGATISLSEDNVKFIDVGFLPQTFGMNESKILFKEKMKAKYLRFKYSSYLGIGYLKIN